MILSSSYSTTTMPPSNRIQVRMEPPQNGHSPVFRKSNHQPQPFEPLQNLAKKRPSSTKLDIEKMYQQSLELASRYKQLMKENHGLKDEYQRVEAIKHNRQNLISAVEKIVAEKSTEIKHRNKTKFSWLVHNLSHKITELRGRIEAKEKAIGDIAASKESRTIRQKQQEIEHLNASIQQAQDQGTYRPGAEKDPSALSEIKEIVWMEQELSEKEAEIGDAEIAFQQEEEQVRALMLQLAAKKAELKSIKGMEEDYHRAQEVYKEEKRKKEQRIAGNKTYLEELQNQKGEEVTKLEHLRLKFSCIEEEEEATIQQLQLQLQQLRTENEERIKTKQKSIIKESEKKIQAQQKKEVRRATLDQVKLIAGNVNYTLALQGISHSQIGSYFSRGEESSDNPELSIREVTDILSKAPFSVRDRREALLLARYTIQDAGDGYFLEDMDTSQSVSIIRSILGKLIGEVTIFSRQEAEEFRQRVGPVLSKFGKLVQQSLDVKEGLGMRQSCRQTAVTREAMVDALQNSLSALQNETFLQREVEFTILYLFSWSHNLDRLEMRRLFIMEQDGLNWGNL